MIPAYYTRQPDRHEKCFAEVSKIQRQTIILNHPQGWDGKPKGLPETAGSPKYLNDMVTRFLLQFVAHAHVLRTIPGETMSAWLLKNLIHTSVLALLISSFTASVASSAHAEAIFIFRTAGLSHPATVGNQLAAQKNAFLRLDQNGDLLMQFGKAKFTVAYNAPTDLLKPLDQPQNLQFVRDASAINGISLKASLSF